MTQTDNFYQLETLLEPVFIASNYMADDGRPLAEMTAVNEIKKGVEFNMRKCPYSGSRFDKVMNVSALPGLSLQIKNVISDTLFLRKQYLAFINETDFSLYSFWCFTRVLDSMPAFLVRRRVNAVDIGSVPARVSAMFKAAQGLHLAPEVMLLDGAPLDSTVSTDALIDFIEQRDLFMDDGRACAGPISMVRAFVSSAVEGVGKEADTSELMAILGDKGVEDLFRYANAVSRVFASKILFEAECRAKVKGIVQRINDDTLIKISERSLKRFGSLRRRNSEAKLNVQNNFLKIANLPHLRPTSPFIERHDRLVKMAQLRNPLLSKEVIGMAVEELLKSIGHLSEWAKVFSEGQNEVLATLGYDHIKLVFSPNDLWGLGYLQAEVLSLWLNLKISVLPDSFAVKAGASCESFDWCD